METTLITDWATYSNAAKETLRVATQELRIFDANLQKIELDTRTTAEFLKNLLHASTTSTITIITTSAIEISRDYPRLSELCQLYSQRFRMFTWENPTSPLPPAMVLADHHAATIRFSAEQARSKLIYEAPSDQKIYRDTFDEILASGNCTQVYCQTLGL